jgi:hypothetical protein
MLTVLACPRALGGMAQGRKFKNSTSTTARGKPTSAWPSQPAISDTFASLEEQVAQFLHFQYWAEIPQAFFTKA